MDALIAAENGGMEPLLLFGGNGRETKSPSILAGEDTLMVGVVMVVVVVVGEGNCCPSDKKK